MTSTGRSGARPRIGRLVTASLGVSLVAWAAVGCSLDSLLKNGQVPPDKTDPAISETPAGALAVYHGTIVQFQLAFGGTYGVVDDGGLLSDELRLGRDLGGGIDLIDARLLPEGGNSIGVGTPFADLQKVRGQAGQAIGLLTQYVPEAPALVGHSYALEGYAEVMLAELFCSGIPLSTLDFGGNYTLRPGSTTAEVFQHAVALFDTALVLASDSARFVDLAAVGKARALLGLGDYAAAAAAGAAVPDGYHYDVSYSAAVTTTNSGIDPRNFIWVGSEQPTWLYSIADREGGGNGLDYLSSGDPRSAGTLQKANNGYGYPVYMPAKYATDGSSPIVLASGVEARLIEAEAALQAGDAGTWLAKLNALRTDGTFDPPDTLVDTLGVTGCAPTSLCGTAPAGSAVTKGQPANYPPAGYDSVAVDITYPAPTTPVDIQAYCLASSYYAPCSQGDSMVVYTYVKPPFFHAGSGGMAGLAPLADPGTADGRVDLLFRERALWLFLTGHRQGDLRRLLRQYDRPQEDVYPIGPYPGATAGQEYGSDVTLPIPSAERVSNPLFHGCFTRDA